MDQLFNQSVAVERVELLLRLLVDSECSVKDKDVAISWIADTLGELKVKNSSVVESSAHQ